MENIFTDTLIDSFAQSLQVEPLEEVYAMAEAYSGALGINTYRNLYMLDRSGNYIDGTNENLGMSLERTPNLIAAMAGKVGNATLTVSSYMDYAVPIGGQDGIILYVKDTNESLQDFSWMLFSIIVQALLVALLIAIALSILLSRTITKPIQDITDGAQRIAAGDFSQKLTVRSKDEIGTLTHTFNNMATVLKNTLDQIDREKDKLETLLGYMTDGVVAFNPQGDLLHINRQAHILLAGLENLDRLTYRTMAQTLNLSTAFEEIVSLQERQYITATAYNGDIILKLFMAPFYSQNTDGIAACGGVIIVIHDDTVQQKLDASRREFVANVSHELRTPITAIKSYAETMLESPELPEDLRVKFLGVIINESDRMTRIVKDLLLLSRLDNQRMDWRFSTFALKDLLTQIEDTMIIDANAHKHVLSFQVDESVGNITADRERLEQVVVNIISNAIKYTPNAGQ